VRVGSIIPDGSTILATSSLLKSFRATKVCLTWPLTGLSTGAVGYVRYVTGVPGVPGVPVAVHMLGASLLVVAQVRMVLSLRERTG